MPARIASSAQAVPYSRVRELAELAMRMDAETADPGEKVLRLYFGESNIPTPEFIRRAARKAMADGYLRYTENAGLLSTRRALASHYSEMHGVELDPESEIVVTASGVQALNTGIRITLDPGDEALVLTPAWPNGSAIARYSCATPVEIPLALSGNRYEIDFDALERAVTPRTRTLIYTSPSNPLGWTATERDQERLLEFTRRHELWLLADEVYERLYYPRDGRPLGTPAPSILRQAAREDAVIVVQSFSKSYCMTGWRVGWLVARRDLAAKAAELNEIVVSCASGFAQRAAETALLRGESSIREMLARLKESRDFCLAALRRMPGVTAPEPEGAFYVFPRIEGLTDSFDFCRRLLVETKVGIAPGGAFGAGGEGSLRICYASDRPLLETAIARLARFLEK
ncbi:MAG: pyridoxal phosphate-dependent aminotransferase [Acidobacteria bacterium]|nr:pyridoxal phosphate-dependent aminotransferase [Acidobacteriota bacterium]